MPFILWEDLQMSIIQRENLKVKRLLYSENIYKYAMPTLQWKKWKWNAYYTVSRLKSNKCLLHKENLK